MGAKGFVLAFTIDDDHDDGPDEWVAGVGSARITTRQIARAYKRHIQALRVTLVSDAEPDAAETSTAFYLIQSDIIIVELVVVSGSAGRRLVQCRVDTTEVLRLAATI